MFRRYDNKYSITSHLNEWYLQRGTSLECKVLRMTHTRDDRTRMTPDEIVWQPSTNGRVQAGRLPIVWVNKALREQRKWLVEIGEMHKNKNQTKSAKPTNNILTSPIPARGTNTPLQGRASSNHAPGNRAPSSRVESAKDKVERQQIDADLVEIMAKLLDNGVYIHAVDDQKRGVLHFAAMAGATKPMVACMLDKQAFVNGLDELGLSALHLASARGYTDLAKQLLRAWPAAEPNLTCATHGQTALHLAAKHGHLDVVKTLRGYQLKKEAAWRDKHLKVALPHGKEDREPENVPDMMNTVDKHLCRAVDYAFAANHADVALYLVDEMVRYLATLCSTLQQCLSADDQS